MSDAIEKDAIEKMRIAAEFIGSLLPGLSPAPIDAYARMTPRERVESASETLIPWAELSALPPHKRPDALHATKLLCEAFLAAYSEAFS